MHLFRHIIIKRAFKKIDEEWAQVPSTIRQESLRTAFLLVVISVY